MLHRLLLPLFLTAVLFPLHGQEDGPIKMTPELALAIPLQQQGRDVTLKFPVLINHDTVIKPGMILRVIYVPPISNDSNDLALAHKGNMEQSFSRNTMTSDEKSRMSPELAHFLEGQRRIVWQVPINFQLALAQLPTDSIHLIYSTTGQSKDLDDERFDFFEGLFLGAPSGGVSVLAVEIGSKSDKAGFKPGDRILAIDGKPTDDLAAFPALWVAAKATAKENQATSFPLVVRSTGENGSHTLNMGMPPSIKSQLMEGF